jgi:hypothetical protein
MIIDPFSECPGHDRRLGDLRRRRRRSTAGAVAPRPGPVAASGPGVGRLGLRAGRG